MLADHKLLVGDATDSTRVQRLMTGEAADLVFMDLAYNVDYEGYTEEHLKIQGDRMSAAEFKSFLERALRSYHKLSLVLRAGGVGDAWKGRCTPEAC